MDYIEALIELCAVACNFLAAMPSATQAQAKISQMAVDQKVMHRARQASQTHTLVESNEEGRSWLDRAVGLVRTSDRVVMRSTSC